MLRRLSISTFAVAIAVALFAPSPARAECVNMTAQQVLALPHVEILFSGRVVEIARTGELGYRATFDVDRVWKGTAPRRFDLYVWERAGEMPHWLKDQHAIVSAARLSNDGEVRRDVGIDANQIAFTPTQCSGLPPHAEDDLGPGYPPTDAQVADFGFRFESSGVGCVTERLDTFTGAFTYRGPFTDSAVAIPLQTLTAHIALTDSEMKAVQQATEDIRFFEYPSTFVGVPEGLKIVEQFRPAYKYRMEVRYGTTEHTVAWVDDARPTTVQADRLRAFFSTVLGFIHDHAEFKQFPRPLPCGE